MGVECMGIWAVGVYSGIGMAMAVAMDVVMEMVLVSGSTMGLLFMGLLSPVMIGLEVSNGVTWFSVLEGTSDSFVTDAISEVLVEVDGISSISEVVIDGPLILSVQVDISAVTVTTTTSVEAVAVRVTVSITSGVSVSEQSSPDRES